VRVKLLTVLKSISSGREFHTFTIRSVPIYRCSCVTCVSNIVGGRIILSRLSTSNGRWA